MGFNVASIYANIFMSVLGEEAMYTLELFKHVHCWLRYEDNVFLVWDVTSELLEEFHTQLNGLDLDVQFTLAHSTRELHFLDTKVFKRGDTLGTDLLVKTTDRNNILCYQSGYPLG